MHTISALALAVFAGSAMAQASDPFDAPSASPSTESARQPVADPLRGPRVGPAGSGQVDDAERTAMMAQPTLVRMGYTGRLERLDVQAEYAALDLLELDQAARASVDEAVAGYTARFDALVMRNISAIIGLQNARGGGDRSKSIGTLMDLLRQVRELERDGSLADAITGALPRDQADRFESLVDEYKAALRADIIAEAAAKGERLSRWQAGVRLRFLELGNAAKDSFDRQLGNGDERIQQMLIDIEATPEQTQKIQAMLQVYIGERIAAGDLYDRGAQVELFRKIMAELTLEQRIKALRTLEQSRRP